MQLEGFYNLLDTAILDIVLLGYASLALMENHEGIYDVKTILVFDQLVLRFLLVSGLFLERGILHWYILCRLFDRELLRLEKSLIFIWDHTWRHDLKRLRDQLVVFDNMANVYRWWFYSLDILVLMHTLLWLIKI